jgi:hypothetical protein
MKSPRLLPLVTLVLAAAAFGGCNHATSPRSGSIAAANPRAVTYALAVSVAGGLQPSPAQWASIQATFSRILAAEGLVLVTDLSLADRILRVDFLPDLTDPENRGQAVIVSVRPNALRGSTATLAPTLASYYPYPSSFGWSGYSWGSPYGFGWDPFYGYGNSYYDGYSYGSPTLNPRRPVPPPGYTHHHHPYPGIPDPKNPDANHRHHPSPPGDKCPPLLAATPPAPATPDPVVYPGSAPGRNTIFQDDVRLTQSERSLAWTTPDSRYDGSRASRAEAYRARQESNSGTTSAPAEHRSWLSRLINPGDSNSAAASTSYNRGDRTYSRSDSGGGNAERTWSRGDSTYSRNESNAARGDSSTSRSESYRSHSDSSSNSSGGSSYSHSSASASPPASSSSSSGSSSYSSGSSSGSSSYSSSSGSSSGGSGTSSGSTSSPAPAPSTTVER